MNTNSQSSWPSSRLMICEYLLLIHTVMTYLLSSSASYVWYLNFFSIFTAAVIFWELFVAKGWRLGPEWGAIFTPLFMIAAMGLIAAFFDPITKGFAFKIVYVYALALMYYSVVLATGRIWFLVWGLFASLGFIFMSQGLGASSDAIELGVRAKLALGASDAEESLNVNTYALICLMSMAFAMYQFFEVNQNIKGRVLRFLMRTICLGVIAVALQQIVIVTGSRKGMIFVFYWLVVSGLMSMRGRISLERFFVAVLIALLLGALSLVALYFSPFFWRFEELYYGMTGHVTDEMSYVARTEFIEAGIGMWLNSPIYGDFCRMLKEFGTYSHSNPVELLINHGIIGFGLYYIYYFIYVARFYLPCIKSGVEFLVTRSVFIGCFLLMFFLWEIAAVNYYSRYSWPVIGTLLGMAAMDIRRLRAVRSQHFSR